MRLIVFVGLIVAARAHSSYAGTSGPSNSQPLENSPSNAPICSSGGEPVCATDGREYIYFQNACHLDAHNYKQLFAGKPSLLQTATSNCFVDCSQKVCLAIYEPVCANQYGTSITKTFGNKCQVNLEICSTKIRWTIIYEGPCVQDRKCSKSCSTEYKPVCATYNYQERTFSNECELVKLILETKQDWRVIHDSPCDQTPCTKIYQPICASLNGNLQTFPNQCVLDNEIKSSGNAWKIVYEGECQSSSSTSSNNGQEAIAAAGTYGKITNPSELPGATTPSNRYAYTAAPGQPDYKNGAGESGTGYSAINEYGKVPYSNQQPSAKTPSAAGIIPCGLNQQPAAPEPSILPAPIYTPGPPNYGSGSAPNPGLPSGTGAVAANGYAQPAAHVPFTGSAPISTYGQPQYGIGTAPNPDHPSGTGAYATNGYGKQPAAPVHSTGSAPISAPVGIPCGPNQKPIPPTASSKPTYAGYSLTNDYGQKPAPPAYSTDPTPISVTGQPEYGNTLSKPVSSPGATSPLSNNWWWCVQGRNTPSSGTAIVPCTSTGQSTYSNPGNDYGQVQNPNRQPSGLSDHGKNSWPSSQLPTAPVLPIGPAPAQLQYGNGPLSKPASSSGTPSGNTAPTSNNGWWHQLSDGNSAQPSSNVGFPSSGPNTAPGQSPYSNSALSSGASASPKNVYGQVPSTKYTPIAQPAGAGSASSSDYGSVLKSASGQIPCGSYQQPSNSLPHTDPTPISKPGQTQYKKEPVTTTGTSGSGTYPSNGNGQTLNSYQQPTVPTPYIGPVSISATSQHQYGSGTSLSPSASSGTPPLTGGGATSPPLKIWWWCGHRSNSQPSNSVSAASLYPNTKSPYTKPGLPSGSYTASNNGYGQVPSTGHAPIPASGQPKYGRSPVASPDPQADTGSSPTNGYGQQPVASEPIVSEPALVSVPGQPQYGSGSPSNPGLPTGAGTSTSNGYGQQPTATALAAGPTSVSAPGESMPCGQQGDLKHQYPAPGQTHVAGQPSAPLSPEYYTTPNPTSTAGYSNANDGVSAYPYKTTESPIKTSTEPSQAPSPCGAGGNSAIPSFHPYPSYSGTVYKSPIYPSYTHINYASSVREQYPYPAPYPPAYSVPYPCSAIEPEPAYLSHNSPQLDYILEQLADLKAYESGKISKINKA